MKKTALVAAIIVTIAMMIGAQSALAAKPAQPVTGIANGQVTYIHSSDFGVAPTTDVGGPWKLIVHLNQGTINFSATCQTSVGVVKVSAIGPATWSYDETTETLTVTGVTFTIKCKGVTHNPTGTITVSASAMEVNFGYPGPTGAENIKGNVRLFKGVP